MTFTTTDAVAASELAPAATPVRRRPKGVFPARKLTDEQEIELTRLYTETPTPLAEIGKRYEIALTSVVRIAKRHGATLRSPTTSRVMASDTPLAIAVADTGLAVETETRTTAPQLATQSAPATIARTPKSATNRPRTTPAAHRPIAEASVEAPTATSGTVPNARRRQRTAGVARSTELPQFVVTFLAEQTLQAKSALDALQQAQARGATEVTSIVRMA